MADQVSALDLMKKNRTKKITFMGGELEIKMLTFNQIKQFSELAEAAENANDIESNSKQMAELLKVSVVGMEELSIDDIGEIPLGTLTDVVNEVLLFNGLRNADSEAGSLGNG